MKRYSLCPISAILLAVCLLSCGQTPAETPEETGSTMNSDTETAAFAEPEYPDFGGETVSTLLRSEFTYEFKVESESGDTIDDAVYQRNLDISERYHVNLKFPDITGTYTTRETFVKAVADSVLAGDGAYDLVAGAANYLMNAVPNGYFIDLFEEPTLDFSREIWPRGFTDNMQLGGSLYLATGPVSLNYLENMCVLFFNKNMIRDNDLTDPYSLVRNGAWTFDALKEMAEAVTLDLNGDGKLNIDDRIGLFTYGNMVNAQEISFGIDLSTRSADGYPVIAPVSERAESACADVAEFNKNKSMLIYTGSGDTLQIAAEMQSSFAEGEKLFMAQVLSSAAVMRSMECDFGILPMPKYDMTQENYRTCIMENVTVLGIPVSAKSTELSGTILSAFAEEGYSHMTPAFFEIAMKGKYSRDEESAEMLDLLRDTVWFDFAYINSSSLGGICHLFCTQAKAGKPLSSEFAKQEKTYTSSMEKLIEGYRELKGNT